MIEDRQWLRTAVDQARLPAGAGREPVRDRPRELVGWRAAFDPLVVVDGETHGRCAPHVDVAEEPELRRLRGGPGAAGDETTSAVTDWAVHAALADPEVWQQAHDSITTPGLALVGAREWH